MKNNDFPHFHLRIYNTTHYYYGVDLSVKGRSYVEGKECATVALSKENYVESITNITQENEDAKSN